MNLDCTSFEKLKQARSLFHALEVTSSERDTAASVTHATLYPLHTPQAEPFMRHATTILTKCFNWYFNRNCNLVTLARFWYVLPEDGLVGPKYVGAM
jgi:hypothetical protein